MFAENAGVANVAFSANSVAASNIAGAMAFGQLPGTLITNDATGLTLDGAFSGSFTGDGGGMTNLNASQLTSGTVADGLLSTNVALLDGTNFFTGTNSFAGVVLATNASNVINGAFTGNLVGQCDR